VCPPSIRFVGDIQTKGTMHMIVIGADPHKSTHTAVAVCAATGQQLGDLTVSARPKGFRELTDWARGLDGERIWAIEDCRHVSGGLERFLVARGERVIRVAPKHMAGARRSVRERGKSDPIDALAVARASLREGLERLPAAFLDPEAMQIKLLLDHREDLEQESTRIVGRLRWHLHDLWPELELPVQALGRNVWLERVGRRLARSEQSTRVSICREQVRDLRRLLRRSRELEREIAQLVKAKNPALLEIPGCGALSAAKLLAQTAGAERFPSDAHFARLAGVAPVPASSGRTDRHRLDRGGDRQLNCALHRIAITQARIHEPARTYLAKKQAEGKSRREALRCLKRQLARTVLRSLRATSPGAEDRLNMAKINDIGAPLSLAALT
jgi:transposase